MESFSCCRQYHLSTKPRSPFSIPGIAALLSLLMAACGKEPAPDMPTEPGPPTVTLGLRTDLAATPFSDAEVLRTLPPGTRLEPRYSRIRHLQVATEDGLVGWIPRRNLREGGTLWVVSQAPLIERPGPMPTAKAQLPPGQRVERVGNPATEGQPTRIRTADGQTGYVFESYLKPVALDYPTFPEVELPFARFDHLRRWIGDRELEELQRYLGPAMAVYRDEQGVLNAHWRNVGVVEEGLRFRGIVLRLDEDEREIEIRGEGYRALPERMPGGPGMRALPLWAPQVHLRLFVTENLGPWYEEKALVRWPVRLVILVLFLALLALPYFVAAAVVPIVGRIKSLSNDMLQLAIGPIILLVAYLNFLFHSLIVTNDGWYMWLAAEIVAAVAAIKYVAHWNRYERCPFCRSIHCVTLIREQELSREHIMVWTGKRREYVRHDYSSNTTYYREHDTYKPETMITSDQYFRCESCREEYILKIVRDTSGHV